jgi:hypothetical protein
MARRQPNARPWMAGPVDHHSKCRAMDGKAALRHGAPATERPPAPYSSLPKAEPQAVAAAGAIPSFSAASWSGGAVNYRSRSLATDAPQNPEAFT